MARIVKKNWSSAEGSISSWKCPKRGDWQGKMEYAFQFPKAFSEGTCYGIIHEVVKIITDLVQLAPCFPYPYNQRIKGGKSQYLPPKQPQFSVGARMDHTGFFQLTFPM